jgi:hypothetical protein
MGRGPVTAAGSEGCAAPRTYRPGRHIAAPPGNWHHAALTRTRDNRASNSEAHRLARSVTASNVGRQVWLLEPPDGLCINTSLYE